MCLLVNSLLALGSLDLRGLENYATIQLYFYDGVRIIRLVDTLMYAVTITRRMSGAYVGHSIMCMVFGILTAVPVSGR